MDELAERQLPSGVTGLDPCPRPRGAQALGRQRVRGPLGLGFTLRDLAWRGDVALEETPAGTLIRAAQQ